MTGNGSTTIYNYGEKFVIYQNKRSKIEMATKAKTDQSFSEIIKGDIPVLVGFYTDWCGPCKIMNPILKKLKKRMGDKITVIKIDAEKNPAAAIRYQVRGVPTLILFKNGQILWQQSGVVGEEQLHAIVSGKIR